LQKRVSAIALAKADGLHEFALRSANRAFSETARLTVIILL